MKRSFAVAVFVVIAFCLQLPAQTAESPSARLRALGAVEVPGAVPLFFVPSAKERALRLQKSLEAAHSWYEKQFNIRVPIVLAVVDAEMEKKLQDLVETRSVPTEQYPRLIAIRDRTTGSPLAADPEHASGGILNNEHVLFHDDGHAFFDALQIGDVRATEDKLPMGAGPRYAYNRTVVEFVAAVFMVAYMQAKRPDLKFLLEDRRFRRSDPPRYGTLAAFDYLDGIGAPAFFWFMAQMERIADALLTKYADFKDSIQKVKAAFHDQAKPVAPDEVRARLETIWPGFTEIAGEIAGPSTIATIRPSACPEPAKDTANFRRIVIKNDSDDVLGIRDVYGRALTVPANSWRSFGARVGAFFILPDDTCLVAKDEPTLLVFGKH
jgi:hypothetical protein